MGGHAAWRKRVAAGGLAKGSGGVSLRHRPHLGRRGAELALNRKGNLGGHGNPKRKATKRKEELHVNRNMPACLSLSMINTLTKTIGVLLLVVIILWHLF
jgi:hypothetical protein